MNDEEHRAERVEALLDLGRYADAASAARTDLARDPESATLHQLLARALIGQGDVPAALMHARAATALEPESPHALYLLAGTLAEVGEGAQACEAALRAVHLAPDDWLSHTMYAHALLFGVRGRGILRQAEVAARRAIELAPHEPRPHVVFGIVRWRVDDCAMAEAAFRRALEIDPSDADAQRNLASLQIGSGSLQGGARTLTSALASHPQDRGLHDDVGYAVGGVLVAAVAGFVLVSLTLGGFLIATDFLLRQRAFVGTIWVLATGAHALKAFRRLPGAGWARLLPWRGVPGDARRRWFAWGMGGLALLVWFTPTSFATPAWFVLAACSTALAIHRFVAVLTGGPRPTNSEDGL